MALIYSTVIKVHGESQINSSAESVSSAEVSLIFKYCNSVEKNLAKV
jgi:hypothetical protein